MYLTRIIFYRFQKVRNSQHLGPMTPIYFHIFSCLLSWEERRFFPPPMCISCCPSILYILTNPTSQKGVYSFQERIHFFLYPTFQGAKATSSFHVLLFLFLFLCCGRRLLVLNSFILCNKGEGNQRRNH